MSICLHQNQAVSHISKIVGYTLVSSRGFIYIEKYGKKNCKTALRVCPNRISSLVYLLNNIPKTNNGIECNRQSL